MPFFGSSDTTAIEFSSGPVWVKRCSPNLLLVYFSDTEQRDAETGTRPLRPTPRKRMEWGEKTEQRARGEDGRSVEVWSANRTQSTETETPEDR